MADSVEEEISELRTLFWSERDPEGRAFAPLADAYRRLGDLDQAQELLQDGINRHASFTPGHIVAAWVRRDRGDVEAAGDAFGTALALDEENTEALLGLGEIAVARGQGDVATRHYQKLIELDPGDLEIVARLREIERLPRAAPMPAMAEAPPAVQAPDPQDLGLEPASPMDAFAAEDLPFLTSADPEPSESEAVDDLPFLTSGEPTPEPIGYGLSDDPDDEGPITRTMADLYARQGLNDRALRVYRRLLERAPGDAGLVERVATLTALVVSASPVESAERLSWPAQLEESGAPAVVPRAEQPADAAPRAPRRSTDDEMETLAQDWARGPHATGEISTPFAWTAKLPPAEAALPDDGRLVREYFRALLEWEPVEDVPAVAEPAPMPAPEPEPEAEPEAVAVAVALAVAPIAVLETVAHTESDAVPIATLSPSHVVPIESLAPDRIVPIESLAPVVVDIASLAP